MASSTFAFDNRRQSRRFGTHHPAKIVLGPDAMISCMVKDISTGGARLAVNPQMDLPESFALFIAAHDLQVRQARICWRNGGFAGVAFSDAEAPPSVHAPQPSSFEEFLDQAVLPAHLAAPARKDLKLYSKAA
ncbi:hypothetical protein GGR34_001722 [Microvirga flocculans]|uniref:PilZ domain-containing protein n=1 Tax=Microvirga flocculans TaxID=217168 RepID=A0A7W6IEL3_9HYPH|nr:PilZ domain-containing protein [Microvirga flocculans]MBB4040071.1 hypothetical protein [Microvirga flocculans]